MGVIGFLLWGLILIVQQASHTASSRAKNSDNLWYSGVVGVFSNGIWFWSQFFIVQELMKAQESLIRLLLVGLFYIAFTVTGTVVTHAYLIKFERRNGIGR